MEGLRRRRVGLQKSGVCILDCLWLLLIRKPPHKYGEEGEESANPKCRDQAAHHPTEPCARLRHLKPADDAMPTAEG